MVLLAASLLACSGGEGTVGPTGTLPGDLEALTVTPSALVPSTIELSWTTPESGRSWIEYGLFAPGERRTDPTLVAATDHRVRLVGLKAGRTYHWRAVTELADGSRLESGNNELTVDNVPQALPRLTLTEDDPSASVASGYIATTLIDGDGGWVVVLDGDGDVVWWLDTGHVGAIPADLVPFVPAGWDGQSLPVTSRLDPATGSVLVQFYDGSQAIDVATFRRVPIDAMSADEIVTTRTELGHHDFVYHPSEGVVAWLAYQVAVQPLDGTRWASDAILETAEGNLGASERTRVWSWLDDFDHEPERFDPLQDAFAVADLADVEWTHSNSLMYDEPSDTYFLMSKFLDCLVKIDRATGEHEWVLGGMYSDFTLPGGGEVWRDLRDTELWSHAHMSHLWYDEAARTGGFVVFDNGYYYPASSGGGEGWSRAAELQFDEDSRTVTKVWEYVEPSGAFTALMGDVRKLDGTYLIGWSSLGRIEEITPQGDVLWRAQTGLGSITGRVSWYESFPP